MSKRFGELQSARFRIRPLRETDVTLRYVSWFSNKTVGAYITAAQNNQTVETLKSYVRDHIENHHSLLLGIFTLDSNRHIGNIKFDQMDSEKGIANVGVLVGEPDWRGKNVFREVFETASQHLSSTMGINYFWLGVDRTNLSAVKAYKKAGFQEASIPSHLLFRPSATGLFMQYERHPSAC